jgi:hypothetical protein
MKSFLITKLNYWNTTGQVIFVILNAYEKFQKHVNNNPILIKQKDFDNTKAPSTYT